MGGTAGIVWQSRQAWLAEASGFCGRFGWWQVVQAIRSLPAWLSWSKVTAPSFAGRVIVPLGRWAAGPAGAAGCGTAASSAGVVGGGAEVTAGGACGCAAGVVIFGATMAGGRAVAGSTGAAVVPDGAGVALAAVASPVAAGPSLAATLGVGDAG
jgi:hypothetical protein